MSSIIYTPDDYNQFNVLNIPRLVIVITLYSLKHYLLFAIPIMAYLPILQRVAQPLLKVMPSTDYSNGALLFSCLPALLVLISMARRRPEANIWLKRFWHHGRGLLLFSLILEIVIWLFEIIFWQQKLNEMILMFLYINVVFIIYLLRSQRTKDVFAEFP